MQRLLLLLLSFFIYTVATAQSHSFVVDIEVSFLKYKTDSVQFTRPKMISINTSGCTEVFSLGSSRRYEFGMRVEILASQLTGVEKFLVGKIYYVKNGTEWKEVMKIEHAEWELKPIAKREKIDGFPMGGASTDYPELCDIRLNDSYYIVK
ncbi:MAG: hypothetical protein JWP69_513 [Flaviaesturariibacter sp.]|nr:hypothetical protein [Flaviaesturariibacter sp.]